MYACIYIAPPAPSASSSSKFSSSNKVESTNIDQNIKVAKDALRRTPLFSRLLLQQRISMAAVGLYLMLLHT
jgi:hypothetical protein